jgi:hypothetical protein
VFLDQSASMSVTIHTTRQLLTLQFGAFAVVAVTFLLPATDPAKEAVGEAPAIEGTGWRKVLRMDYLGSGIMLALVTCLLLALQWGKYEAYPTASRR